MTYAPVLVLCLVDIWVVKLDEHERKKKRKNLVRVCISDFKGMKEEKERNKWLGGFFLWFIFENEKGNE